MQNEIARGTTWDIQYQMSLVWSTKNLLKQFEISSNQSKLFVNI